MSGGRNGASGARRATGAAPKAGRRLNDFLECGVLVKTSDICLTGQGLLICHIHTVAMEEIIPTIPTSSLELN